MITSLSQKETGDELSNVFIAEMERKSSDEMQRRGDETSEHVLPCEEWTRWNDGRAGDRGVSLCYAMMSV